MPEKIYKLQPNRTLQLRGFNPIGAAAALHSATANSFKVSGIFRDSADFAVLVLYDADNFYEHPSIKYLPDFNFNGLTLTFDTAYGIGLQPLDSPKFNWIDWATLDCIPRTGSPVKVRLWDNAVLQTGAFSVASGSFTFEEATGLQPLDQVTLFFQNLQFDYTVPAGGGSIEFQFYASGTGSMHSITIDGRVYSHVESNPNGESSADQATALVAAINNGTGDPEVAAAIGSVPYAVKLTVRPAAAGRSIPVSATGGGGGSATLYQTTLGFVANSLRDAINATDWAQNNTTHALMATTNGATLTMNAARYGLVNTNGTSVTHRDGAFFGGIAEGSTIRIGTGNTAVEYTISSVDGPGVLTITSDAGVRSAAAYVAERGGYDGNMIEMYSLNKTATLKTSQNAARFSGGSSDVTWRISLDFQAHGIGDLRQCWLTFAPPLADGAAFTDTEWEAVFTNWTVAGPEEIKMLQVAGPGSQRIEESDVQACTYSGASWITERGFFSNGYATGSGTPGASVSIAYRCASTHDLWLGTSLQIDRGIFTVSLDGVSLPPLDCFLDQGPGQPPVNTRRKLSTAPITAGAHTVQLTVSANKNNLSSGTICYLDFLEAAVPSDVPDPPRTYPNISPALDYSTDHTYKLSPARVHWIFDKLGFAGPMNEYIGVFWWNQRVSVGATIPAATLTFSGQWAAGDSATIIVGGDPAGVGGASIQKDVYLPDNTNTIAAHFARYINEVFVGIWASAAASVVTITTRSPAYAFNLNSSRSSSDGVITLGGQNLAAPAIGKWVVDPTQSPALNRGARDWHADFYNECKARGREIVTAESMELVDPPDELIARFPNGDPVITGNAFGAAVSIHCAVSAPLLAYQKNVFKAIADLQAAAGLTPLLQFGEFLWWFFTNYNATTTPAGGMGFYDADTKNTAQSALGRPLHIFTGPNDDPSVNTSADAIFLRNRLRDHVAAIRSYVQGFHPSARFELLFPYDVNHPTPAPVGFGNFVGGRLLRFINLPTEWEAKLGSGFDLLKVEALAFGSTRNLDLAKTAIDFTAALNWPDESVKYLVPIFTPASSWEREIEIAFGAGVRVINLWAFDQYNIYGLKERTRKRSARF